jgi:hypothetical protein
MLDLPNLGITGLVVFPGSGRTDLGYFFSPKVRQYPGNEFPEIAHLRFFLHDKLSLNINTLVFM